MSKILEKNSVLEPIKQFWKQCVGLVTDLRNKYWGDIFFRTEFNVIALQITFAVVLSALVSISFNYIYKSTLQVIIDGITENISNHNVLDTGDILNSMQIIRAKNFFGFFAVAVSITLIFSYIIARMTLTPTRNALKYQKRFVSDIAHELRTPLSVIKTNNEVALLDDIDDKTKKIIKNTITELDRASSIINNLLTFNNLVHPEQIQFTPVSMSDVVDTSVSKLDELIKKKEIKLVVKKVSPFTVWGNVTALEQIAINLIKNAVNYNHIGGSVSVIVEPDYRGNILLIVEDSGIGISQKDLSHIFEPFYRAESSRSRHSGSSGLGLTIVSELVKLHSGRINVRSVLKKGTTVTIVLPYSKNSSITSVIDSNNNNEISIDYIKNKTK